LKEKKEGGKKIEQEMRKGPFFSFFHPTLSISVSRLKSLIEVLQPASRPATRRKKKKCIDRNRLSVSFCTILFLLLQLLLSFTNYFFFFAFVVHWASCSAKSFLFISKAGSLLLLIFLC
jgi:hypothetical protein